LIKKTVKENPELMSQYHSELRQIASNDFKFRENGDPTEFCSRAAEMLFKYDPSHILIGSAEPLLYNATLTETFVDLFEPENCIVQICSSDFSANKDLEWEIEPLYR
jgi:insulysin